MAAAVTTGNWEGNRALIKIKRLILGSLPLFPASWSFTTASVHLPQNRLSSLTLCLFLELQSTQPLLIFFLPQPHQRLLPVFLWPLMDLDLGLALSTPQITRPRWHTELRETRVENRGPEIS